MSELKPALPRITIEFCTQCKWMLRAAYFAQELLSTFSTSLGEVALQPSTGGTFIVQLHHAAESDRGAGDGVVVVQKHLLWDRKAEGGFPEIKELKRRVRDIIDPSRHLGHVDSHVKKPSSETTTHSTSTVIQDVAGGPSPPSPPPSSTIPPPPSATTARDGATEAPAPAPSPLPAPVPVPGDAPLDSSKPGAANDVEVEPEKEKENDLELEKVVISGGEGVFFCRPGDEDCG